MSKLRITCAHFRRLGDGTLWALRCEAGRPVRAAGPLRDEQLEAAAIFADFAGGTDATGWDLADFERIGPEYVLTTVPERRFRVEPVSRDDGDAFSTFIN